MKPIKVEFYQHDNFVCGRVLDMPDEIRGIGEIIYNDEYAIKSKAFPYFYENELYIRGTTNDKGVDNMWFYRQFLNTEDATRAIIAYKTLIQKWNNKHRDILNEKEKEYLRAVIKPFKKKVISIRRCDCRKEETLPSNSYISITLKGEPHMNLPYFTRSTMYKDMEGNIEYTLKELGLE